MKKIWFLICIMPSICYPQINENGINKDYWKNKPSACVHVFNNPQFVGLLLDGKKLEQNEIHLKKIIENITGLMLGSNAFNSKEDTLIVFDFEECLQDTLKKNDTLLSCPPDANIDFYYRQYLFLNYNDLIYLFVGFHVNTDELRLKNGKYFYNNSNSLKVQLNDFNLILDSRRFIYQHYKWTKNDLQFYILFDIESNKMFFYRSNYW